MCIYIYIYIYIRRCERRQRSPYPAPLLAHVVSHYIPWTPSPPIKSFPIKSSWVKPSGRLPIKLIGHENSHP